MDEYKKLDPKGWAFLFAMNFLRKYHWDRVYQNNGEVLTDMLHRWGNRHPMTSCAIDKGINRDNCGILISPRGARGW